MDLDKLPFSFRILIYKSLIIGTAVLLCVFDPYTVPADTIKIGLNYPETGPYAAQGLDQRRAVDLAVEEMNAAGGILNHRIEIVVRDTASDPREAVVNATEMIDKFGVKMILGGVSSGVAVAMSDLCQEKGMLFMATITASNATTGEHGHRHTFRVSYNAWMGAKAMSSFLKSRFSGKKYFYVVSDYTWGWSSEASIRKFTGTEDISYHKRVLTPLGANEEVFKKAVNLAALVKPDVLVLVLFGQDMSTAIRLATLAGLKKNAQIIVPILELALAEGAGPKVMEGVIGTSDWNWSVPYEYGYTRGQTFIERFISRFKRYPSWGASTAYTNMWEYKQAAERVGTFDIPAIIKSLEGHKFTLLADEKQWRDFDHQVVQSVYIVRCKPQSQVLKDPMQLDYFEILQKIPGDAVVQTRNEWNQRRLKAGLPPKLEKLPGE